MKSVYRHVVLLGIMLTAVWPSVGAPNKTANQPYPLDYQAWREAAACLLALAVIEHFPTAFDTVLADFNSQWAQGPDRDRMAQFMWQAYHAGHIRGGYVRAGRESLAIPFPLPGPVYHATDGNECGADAPPDTAWRLQRIVDPASEDSTLLWNIIYGNNDRSYSAGIAIAIRDTLDPEAREYLDLKYVRCPAWLEFQRAWGGAVGRLSPWKRRNLWRVDDQITLQWVNRKEEIQYSTNPTLEMQMIHEYGMWNRLDYYGWKVRVWIPVCPPDDR